MALPPFFYSGKNIVVPLSVTGAVLPLPICNSSPWECLLLLLYPDAGIQCCMDDQSMPLCLVGCSYWCSTHTSRRVRARIQGQLRSYSACSTLGHYLWCSFGSTASPFHIGLIRYGVQSPSVFVTFRLAQTMCTTFADCIIGCAYDVHSSTPPPIILCNTYC